MIYTSEFDTPTKFINENGDINEYRYYYGNINDNNISLIVMSFFTNSVHIEPVDNKYYSALTVNNSNIEYIKGVDPNMETAYEYKY